MSQSILNQRLKKGLVAIFSLLVVASCKSTNSPKAVTETFLVSVARLDIGTAKNYSTKQTWDFLKVLEKETKVIPEEEREVYIDDFKVTILEEKQIHDSLYTVRFKTEPQLLPFDKLNLIAEKNLEGNLRWKIDFNSFDFIQSDTTIQEVMMPGVEPEILSDSETGAAN